MYVLYQIHCIESNKHSEQEHGLGASFKIRSWCELFKVELRLDTTRLPAAEAALKIACHSLTLPKNTLTHVFAAPVRLCHSSAHARLSGTSFAC